VAEEGAEFEGEYGEEGEEEILDGLCVDAIPAHDWIPTSVGTRREARDERAGAWRGSQGFLCLDSIVDPMFPSCAGSFPSGADRARPAPAHPARAACAGANVVSAGGGSGRVR
jgi:hypothetical protein